MTDYYNNGPPKPPAASTEPHAHYLLLDSEDAIKRRLAEIGAAYEEAHGQVEE